MKHRHLLFWLLPVLLSALLLSCGAPEPQPPADTGADAGTQPPDSSAEPEPEDTTDYAALADAPFLDLAPAPESDFTWTATADGVTVTGYTGQETRLRIPDAIGGLPVTGLADGALKGRDELTVLWIPDSVTTFGSGILADCSGIYALHTPLPTGADQAYLGYLYGALSHQTNNVAALRTLEFLQIGGSPKSLPAYALYDCNDLVCVRLPESVATLEEFSLYRCESLKYLDTAGLRTVERYALGHCAALEVLEFGSSLSSLGLGALENCTSLRRLTLPFVGGSATENRYLGYVFGAAAPGFSGGVFPSSLREVTLLPGCDSLGDYAFYECRSLRSVSLCDTLASIGVRAFSGCTGLREIALPDSLQTLRESAFSGCSSLGKVTFGSGLTSVGVQAFLGCTALTELTLPASLTSLPNSCFSGCSSLREVDLGGVRSVGANAFYGCTALTALSASGPVDFASGNSPAADLLEKD